MDQVKEILKQLIHYRFWIAVGFAALFPMIGYFAGAGTIRDETTKKAAEIEGAKKGVAPFTSGEVKNSSFTNVVRAKTDVLNKNVDETWRLLYERQAPLLDWPESVQDYFPKWGRKWPEDVDRNEVDRATRFYMRDYNAYVHKVYETARPFDYEEGTGVVVTPSEAELLAPSKFDINKPPRMGNVWDAQEKLWLQRTVLDVIAQVNKNAKDWSGAQVKQILALQVGGATSQDQKSLVAGETLEKAPAVLAEGEEDPDAADGSSDTGMAGLGLPGKGAGGGMMVPPGAGFGGGGMSSGGMSGGTAADAGPIQYITTENPSTQYRLYPVHVKLLVDQNYIPELLAAFQNSPMTIDVREVSIQRPPMRITKPTKGSSNMFGGYGMMGGMMGGYEAGMAGMGMFGGGGYGGMMPGEGMGMGGRGMPPGGGYGGMMPGGYGGMMGGQQAQTKKGISLREEQKQKKREAELKRKDQEKKGDEEPKYELYDPYADIVMIDVYGQARLYNAPPEPEAIEPSEAAADGGEPTDEMTADPPKTPEADPADQPADPSAMPADEPKKPEADPADQPADPSAMPADEPKKPDQPADEPKKPDQPADEPKKPDQPAGEPKAETPQRS